MRKKNWIAVLVLLSFLFSLVPAYAFSFSIPEIWAATEGEAEGQEPPEGEEPQDENEIIVKHLIVPINFTWGQKAADGSWHYDHGAPGETQEYSGSFDGSWLMDEYKGKLEVVSVEPYNGSNFDFEGAYDFWYKNDVVQTKEDFRIEYVKRSLSGLSVTSYEIDEAKVYFSYQGTLVQDRALDIMPKAAREGGSIALDEMLYPLMGGGIAAQKAYPEVCNLLEKEMRGKTPNLEKSQMYCWFNPIVVTFKITQNTDLAVDKITIPSASYPPNTAIDIYVDIANNGGKQETSIVRFDLNGVVQEREVTLDAGAKQKINFAVTTPPTEGSYTVTAEINPDRTIVEQDYDNNKKTAQLVVKEIKEEIAPCKKTCIWTEMEIEWVTDCDEYSCWTYPIYHYFTYKATLAVGDAKVTDDRSNLGTDNWLLDDNGTVHNWIRAGYGVKVNAKASVTVEQISGDWSRGYEATVTARRRPV